MNEEKPRPSQDQVLVDLVQPPATLAKAFLAEDGVALALLLDLLFSAHEIRHIVPGRSDNFLEVWHHGTDTIQFRNIYEKRDVPPCLQELAPDWAAYVTLAEKWFHDFPHECVEYDYWFWGHDEPREMRSLDYFREMLRARIPAEESPVGPDKFSNTCMKEGQNID